LFDICGEKQHPEDKTENNFLQRPLKDVEIKCSYNTAFAHDIRKGKQL
jgi:hypothetical protein